MNMPSSEYEIRRETSALHIPGPDSVFQWILLILYCGIVGARTTLLVSILARYFMMFTHLSPIGPRDKPNSEHEI